MRIAQLSTDARRVREQRPARVRREGCRSHATPEVILLCARPSDLGMGGDAVEEIGRAGLVRAEHENLRKAQPPSLER